MHRLWLITNPSSGSATPEKCAALEAIFGERGLELAGRTIFPEDGLPEIEELIEANIDTVVLFAGDGTVNAAACKYDRWKGEALVLPGGTMNILARRLHGEADPHDIVHKAHEQGNARAMPFVQSGPHRAFCSLIIGPAAAWAQAREAVRYRALRRFRRAVQVAWARTWAKGVCLFDGTRQRGAYKAILISPEDGWLKISGFSTRGFMDAAKLGWEWLTGNWQDAPTVDNVRSAHVTVTGPPAIHSLFDGEEVMLKSPARVSSGVSNLAFVSTIEPEVTPVRDASEPERRAGSRPQGSAPDRDSPDRRSPAHGA